MRSAALTTLLLFGCVSGPRALSTAQLAESATRHHRGAFDEVFDATLLSLERMGLRVVEVDVTAGTASARRPDGTGYEVSVRGREADQLVTALPVPERAAWQLDGDEGEEARWAKLEALTAELLSGWQEHPEWEFLASKNLLGTLTFRTHLPTTWERLEPSVSRREMVLQQFKARRPVNPTMVFEVKRHTPRVDDREFLTSAAALALGARGRLTWPGEGQPTLEGGRAEGVVRVMDGAVPRLVSWHLWNQHTPLWTVRVAAVCAPAAEELECAKAWHELLGSIVTNGFSD